MQESQEKEPGMAFSHKKPFLAQIFCDLSLDIGPAFEQVSVFNNLHEGGERRNEGKAAKKQQSSDKTVHSSHEM